MDQHIQQLQLKDLIIDWTSPHSVQLILSALSFATHDCRNWGAVCLPSIFTLWQRRFYRRSSRGTQVSSSYVSKVEKKAVYAQGLISAFVLAAELVGQAMLRKKRKPKPCWLWTWGLSLYALNSLANGWGIGEILFLPSCPVTLNAFGSLYFSLGAWSSHGKDHLLLCILRWFHTID